MLKITLMLLLYAHNKWTLNGDGCTGACLLGSNAGVSDFAGLPKFNWHEFSKVLVFLVLCWLSPDLRTRANNSEAHSRIEGGPNCAQFQESLEWTLTWNGASKSMLQDEHWLQCPSFYWYCCINIEINPHLYAHGSTAITWWLVFGVCQGFISWSWMKTSHNYKQSH